ncbi:headcase protein [Anopheles aquasalis]|uniref:headcase protein n=1 Tax=Anopheles aquasalis TaxID=42839 RepID=UPI00215B53C6|nr:headcase protein [Anopheles aquasalis]
MAPRRGAVATASSVTTANTNGSNSTLQQQQQQHQIQQQILQSQTSLSSLGGLDLFGGLDSDHGFESSHSADGSGSEGSNMGRCCIPAGECLKPLGDYGSMINLEDLRDCVRVLCSNDSCTAGQYMHRECFEQWEEGILGYLKSIGRARSWSEKQRQQNLWTKKGYDLVYKMCGCKCGRGHLKKDLDWIVPTTASLFGRALIGTGGGNNGGGGGGGGIIGDTEELLKKKKKRNRQNQKQSQQQQQQQHQQAPQPLLAISTSGNHSMTSSANSSATNSPNGGGNQLLSLQHHHGSSSLFHHHQHHHHQQPSAAATSNALSVLSTLKLSDHFANSLILNGTGGGGGNSVSGLGAGGNHFGQHHNQQQQQQQITASAAAVAAATAARMRANSLSSISNGSSTPPASGTSSVLSGSGVGSDQSISPVHHHHNHHHLHHHQQHHSQHQQQQQLQPPSPASIAKLPLTPKSKVELYSERVRATSGANGIFSRRLDFSSFNALPRQRINSYSIKIEDEGNHGNDETRLFILSSLAAQHKSRVACILCEEPMLVFDRYPLVDGTFFLSPKQHAKGCIEVKYENRVQYLTSVCMACLDGVEPNRAVRCRFCAQKWDGSSLVLGTMYSYDIFAAMPCCTERLKCNTCFKLLLHPHQRLNFYSDYSHSVSCPYCSAQDTHFVKPLAYCYTKQPMQLFQHWP